MNYRFALCDDEKVQMDSLERKVIKILCERDMKADIDQFDSGYRLIESLRKKHYDIIFLDIQMQQIDGIAIGKKIRENNQEVIIIYITGFMDYAINAFEIRAFDYILKPVNEKKLQKTIEEALVKIKASREKNVERKQYFTLNNNKKIVNILFDDIIYFEKFENRVIVTCKNCSYEVYDSLSNIYNRLSEDLFIQTHQSYIVNKDNIKLYEKQQIILLQEYIIPVSKKNIKKVKRIFYESLR